MVLLFAVTEFNIFLQNEKSKCSITTNYAVKLVSSIGSTITAANRTTNNCIGTECFVRLTPMLNQTTKFNEVSVVASNQYTNEGNNFTSFKQIGKKLYTCIFLYL